ncbi:restriction endonuclease subunit S [Limosilactobacillus mucosae]|uniref:restriction endonuclease subunit S n=3 Tax=Limosilactobacillus mucosae TaxID=97478 RepID=UPI003B42FC5B
MTKQNEKDAKRVPELRFKGFTDDWEQRKLGETFLFKKNNTFSRSELSFENGYVKNIHYGDILVKYNEYLNVHNNSNIPFVTKNIPSNFSSSYLQDGDIVMADTAEDETVGKSTEISSLSSNDRVLAGLHTIPLSPKQKFGSGFLGFYLNSNSYHDKLRPLMQGIKVTSISKTNLKNTILQFPKELEEQKRIGKLFIKLNRTITLHEEQHRQLERLKKALLQKMFADETGYPALRFKGFTAKWEQRKLGDITRRYDNLRVPVTASKRKHGDIPYYGANGIQDFVSGYTHDGEFILVAEDGARDPKNYPVNYVNGKIWVNNHAHVLQGIQGLANNLFLLNGIKKINIVAYLVGGSRAKLNAETLMQLSIKLPSIHEQEKIGQLFQSLDKTITLHDKKIQYLKQLKRGLLQKMFV